MDQAYWVFEYVKVLLVYFFMMYLWPTVVFHRHFSGKDRAYRFCFCVTVTILLLNFVVLLLGLAHLLNRYVVIVAYLGAFLVQLVRNFRSDIPWLADLRSVSNKTMTIRRMLRKWGTSIGGKLQSTAADWWRSNKGRRAEFAVLLVLIGFAMAYFSANALQVHSYGASDQYVHHAWIYGLTQGKAFSSGIYPEGMHAFLYVMTTVFGVRLYSAILFLAGIHIQVYIISAYLLSRAIFGWKMTGLFALAGFLTIEQLTNYGISGISRLAWTIPQEFALFAVFLAAYGLIRFLRSVPKPEGKGAPAQRISWKTLLSDRGLIIFAAAVAVCICVHFYVSFIAAFVCLVIVCLNLRHVFRRAAIVRLAAGALAALVIAGLPMAVARLAGYPIQGSFNWAMSVMREEDKKTEEEGIPEEEAGKLREALGGTCYALYGKDRGAMLAGTDAAVVGFSVLLLAGTAIAGSLRKGKNKQSKRLFSNQLLKGYLIVALSLLVLFIAFKPSLLGLPPLVKDDRLCSTIDMFSMLLYACVLDVVFTLAQTVIKEKALVPVSVVVCAGIYVLAQTTGIFHGYLYYNLTRYPMSVELTKEITESLPKYKYTIISTTDELYQVRESGFHEELLDMVGRLGDKTYTIPTPYLFFLIEKRPIVYAQVSCGSGPEWLAAEKYTDIFTHYQYPEIGHGQVSEEYARRPLDKSVTRFYAETELTNRTILESKAYAWYQKFASLHPNEGTVIYEDEDLLCYCVHQNEFSLFSLGVMEE